MDPINKNLFRKKLLLSMERAIASSCYNGNTQNYGAWGVLEDEGRFFRFPLTLFNGDCLNQKSKNPDVGISLDSLKNSYYKFGANELHVVEALDFILTNLEKEYGLDIYRSATNYFIPEEYKLSGSETIFEAELNVGSVGGGWIFDKPLKRDLYESQEGIKCVFVRGALYPICSSARMQKIVENCSDNLWHRFESARLNDQRFFPFFELGSSDDIQKLRLLLGE